MRHARARIFGREGAVDLFSVVMASASLCTRMV